MAPEDEPRTRWHELTGGTSGEEYAARFDQLAASGQDVHGEAALCASLMPLGSRVLDAGCGTGRVAIRLAALGYDVVGLDADESMLGVARKQAPMLPWVHADLADLPSEDSLAAFDLVVMAGNVVPLLTPGTLSDVLNGLVAMLRADGLLVAGFGLDAAHLPPGCPVTTLQEYDAAASAAGLALADRFGTWERTPYDPAEGYAVSLHRRR
ncbi:MAG: class I SAM-dependent methyltransferase [Nocardioidaceae bacterium]